MRLISTDEDPADSVGQLIGGEQPIRLDDLALAWTHIGSIGFNHGLFLGRKQTTMRTPSRSL